MTDVSEAIDIAKAAAPNLGSAGIALVVAIGGLETHWSDEFPKPDGSPSYNWGAVTVGSGWSGDKFEHADSRWTPSGTVQYVTYFRAYPSSQAGAADLAALLQSQYANALAAARRGDWYGVSAALYKDGYYKGTAPPRQAIAAHFKRLREFLLEQGIDVPLAALAGGAGAELLFYAAIAVLWLKRKKR